jgi:predicted TIM-barrel fold metal-dependent hydrolase
MFRIFSVDDHVVEPPHVWSSRVPAKHREAAPHVVEEDGREFWVYEDQRILTMGLNAVAGKPRDQWNLEPTRFTDMIPGCYEPAARAQDMLSQGVLASVAFPTLPRFGGMLFVGFRDKDLASACVQAWNDFILDEWCAGGPPGLFVPMVICQAWDPELAAAEIRRCAEKGAKALCFTENPVVDGLPSFHDPDGHWDPIFATCEEAELPVCMHIGSSGYVPLVDPAAPFTTTISAATAGGQLAMTNMLLSPIPQRFPRIKLVWSEAGIGWVPALLERADRQVARHSGWAGDLEEKPSDIFRRNMWCCMVEEPTGLTLYELIGVDRILAETDYPHADTPYPFTQKAYAEVFAGIPDEVTEAVTHGNAESLFDWTMADDALLTSPDVETWRASLEADQYAAMRQRHAVDGITRGVIEVKPGDACKEMVHKGALIEECGATIGDDGVCEAGHRSW